MHSILSHSRVWSTTPALPACLLEDPFMWMLHWGAFSAPWPSMRMNSAIKSATTCPSIAVHGRYCMSNSLNSTAHNAIHPAASGLLIALHKGLSVRTIMVCSWKYGLIFRAAITNAKASFSIWGYLSSAPHNARLVKYTGSVIALSRYTLIPPNPTSGALVRINRSFSILICWNAE